MAAWEIWASASSWWQMHSTNSWAPQLVHESVGVWTYRAYFADRKVFMVYAACSCTNTVPVNDSVEATHGAFGILGSEVNLQTVTTKGRQLQILCKDLTIPSDNQVHSIPLQVFDDNCANGIFLTVVFLIYCIHLPARSWPDGKENEGFSLSLSSSCACERYCTWGHHMLECCTYRPAWSCMHSHYVVSLCLPLTSGKPIHHRCPYFHSFHSANTVSKAMTASVTYQMSSWLCCKKTNPRKVQ